MLKEEQIFLAQISARIEQSQSNYMQTYTSFLDTRQQTLIEQLCQKRSDIEYAFHGGYDEAERCIAVFMPLASGLLFDQPLVLLRLEHDGYRELKHRDYLGSLLALGIKREMLGDILVWPRGADVITFDNMADFLLQHYEKAGKTWLKAEKLPIENIKIPDLQFELKKDTVASLRLDNLLASAYDVSRSKALEAINSNQVLLNHRICLKADYPIKEGDKLVWRGKGKVILETVGGFSKKHRQIIIIKKYI